MGQIIRRNDIDERLNVYKRVSSSDIETYSHVITNAKTWPILGTKAKTDHNRAKTLVVVTNAFTGFIMKPLIQYERATSRQCSSKSLCFFQEEAGN